MIIWENKDKRIVWAEDYWKILFKHSGETRHTKSIKAVIKSVLFSVRYER